MSRISLNKSMRVVLAVTGPLQSLFDRPGLTHIFCNQQALTILRSDGLNRQADVLKKYITELNAGALWADKGWKNAGHYFEPTSGRGLWRFSTAIEDFRGYYQLALTSTRQGDLSKGIFYLGAAAHIVQDVCVPHHARGKLFDGHQRYEAWAEKNRDRYAVDSYGSYAAKQPTVLIRENAAQAADLLSWVDEKSNFREYERATAILLPRAQCTTADLFWQFASATDRIAVAC